MITEQSEITVTFKIVELLHIHDQLLIAYDHGDDQKLLDYLMDRIIKQVPDFEESEDFAKLLIP